VQEVDHVDHDLNGRQRQDHRGGDSRAPERLPHDEPERERCQENGSKEPRGITTQSEVSLTAAVTVPTAAMPITAVGAAMTAVAIVPATIPTTVPNSVSNSMLSSTHGNTPIK
jgi:hypothetical protein